jgi:methionyl-tRNA formyltransferase
MDTIKSDKPRVVFFGTPEFALPCLEALCEISETALVVSQPDRRSGRGLKLTPPPVRLLAERLRIPVIQPDSVRTAEFPETLRAIKPDLGVVVAFGRILTRATLESPRLGCVNIHASLLPKYRGAAPIQWAIVNGELETGVSLMQMDEGMDTGPVLAVAKTRIEPDATADSLSEKLARLGAELLRDRFLSLIRGELLPVPQDHASATYAPVLRKQDGAITWQKAAKEIHDFVRGMSPWPGAFTWLDDKRIAIHRMRISAEEGAFRRPGSILSADDRGIEVACGRGAVLIEELQVEGRRRMRVDQFLTGYRLATNTRFSDGR